MFPERFMTNKLLLGMKVPAGIIICVPPIVLSSIFHPDISIAAGFGLNNSTHSGLPVLGLGRNSLIHTCCAGAAREIST